VRFDMGDYLAERGYLRQLLAQLDWCGLYGLVFEMET
jgi:hypothetical protein